MALNYDIGHATARGGAGWIDAASVATPYIRALAVKDFVWQRGPKGDWRTEWCPLGEGMVNFPRLVALLRGARFSGPVNVHFEHSNLLGTNLGTWTLDISREKFVEIVSRDLRFLRGQLSQTAAAR